MQQPNLLLAHSFNQSADLNTATTSHSSLSIHKTTWLIATVDQTSNDHTLQSSQITSDLVVYDECLHSMLTTAIIKHSRMSGTHTSEYSFRIQITCCLVLLGSFGYRWHEKHNPRYCEYDQIPISPWCITNRCSRHLPNRFDAEPNRLLNHSISG